MDASFSSAPPEVLICEVGPRDGLQSLTRLLPTPDKLRWIDALHAAGLRHVEVGSFMPARRVPGMADVAEVVRHALGRPGLELTALVPNGRGAQAALDCGVHRLSLPLSASSAHSLASVRKTPLQMIQELRLIAQLRDEVAPQVRIEAGISDAFGCPLDGPVDAGEVMRLAVLAAAAGADEVGLADTAGQAEPAQVHRLFARLRREIGAHMGSAHLHDTRGQGLANCRAAHDAGVRRFDSSLGGLGGCPYAPGTSGNLLTEDLVVLFASLGVRTGIDLPRLLDARALLGRGLADPPPAGTAPADPGPPPGLLPA